MDIVQSIFLGLIEGITEFLPISSTGHLIVASEWLGIAQTDTNKAFEVIIQLASILAVVTQYKQRFHPKHLSLWLKVALAFLPIAAVGFLFRHQIKALFSIEVVPWMFIIGGVIFLLLERYLKRTPPTVHSLDDISYQQAAMVGFAQIFALIPGTSRAGATMVGALLAGMSRTVSAEFSFLLALPVMVAAAGLEFISHYNDFLGMSMMPLVVGFITAYISAWVVMKLFLAFLNRFTLNAFGIYRILFGAVLLYWLHV